MPPSTRLLLSHLRRSSPFLSTFPTSTAPLSYILSNRNHPQPPVFNSLEISLYESFSTRSTDDLSPNPWSNSELLKPEIIDAVSSGTSAGEECILPVRVVVSILDGFHDLTGLPWWFIIVSSTLAMRMTLFPLLILRLHKLKRIVELLPKLPPPLPPPLSGRSYIGQIKLFQKERRLIGCPSLLWFFSYLSVQVPCFFLWMSSIRRMSLDHHPGFDCGGILWFLNLTEYSHGISGPIFPLLIAAFHYTNIQISFADSSAQKLSEGSMLSLMMKYYKHYLDILTLPIFFISYNLPQTFTSSLDSEELHVLMSSTSQGSLVYWATNSSVTIIQQLALKQPAFRACFGIPDNVPRARAAVSDSERENSEVVSDTEKENALRIAPSPQSTKKLISIQNLSPDELVNLSIKRLSTGDKERAIPLLQLALNKDPGCARALIVLGQTLMQKGLMSEATDHLERAISTLLHTGYPSGLEEIDHLILASQWAGVTCVKQGRTAEGLAHLQRIGDMKEPEDPKSKAHYYDGLVLLASSLFVEGQKTEAAKYLRQAVAYDPKYNHLLEQCENPEDDLTSDLVSSRRKDY